MDKHLNGEKLTEYARSVLRDIEIRTAGQKEGVALLHQKLKEVVELDKTTSETVSELTSEIQSGKDNSFKKETKRKVKPKSDIKVAAESN